MQATWAGLLCQLAPLTFMNRLFQRFNRHALLQLHAANGVPMSTALASVLCALITSSSQRRDELATAQSHTKRDVNSNSGWGTCKTLDIHAINITLCATVPLDSTGTCPAASVARSSRTSPYQPQPFSTVANTQFRAEAQRSNASALSSPAGVHAYQETC
jgi:hypothetical protein